MKPQVSGRRGFSSLACVWLIACVSIGSWLILGAGHTPGLSSSPSASSASISDFGSDAKLGLYDSSRPGKAVLARVVQPQAQSIETIRVGQRVTTPETDQGVLMPTDIDASTWKLLRLHSEEICSDGTVDTIEISTLLPPDWLQRNHAEVGATVPIPLDLKEMGLSQTSALVKGIESCPPIQDGPGRVVLTTVNHLNDFLFDLTVKTERGPPELIKVTGWHKLFSESHGWTSVCELSQGEVLRGHDGPLTVVGLSRCPGAYRVYNMTVEQEHQYYVSAADVLAHNANCTTRLWRAVEPSELANVMEYGDYNIHPNSTFKRFAFDEKSLDSFISANPTRSYTKSYVDVRSETLIDMFRHADPGGVGSSIGIDVYEHPEFYDKFDRVRIAK